MVVVLDMLVDELIQSLHRVSDLAIVCSFGRHVDRGAGSTDAIVLLQGALWWEALDLATSF
jgi:hypothetical protein